MFIPIGPAKTSGRCERPRAGRHHYAFHRAVSVFLIYSFTLTMTGIPALVSGARIEVGKKSQFQMKTTDRVQLRAILASMRSVLPQVTLSDFGKCYATTDAVVRDVARGAGVVRVGETLPGGEAPLSSVAAPIRVPGALPGMRSLLQNNRPFIQAVCTVWLPEVPATTTLSDHATFAGSLFLRSPGAAVMSKPYGPFLGAGANPLVTTLPGVRTKRPVALTRRADASERLTVDQPRLSPQSGVPPGWNETRSQVSRPSFLNPLDPRRSTPDNRPLPEISPASLACGPNGRTFTSSIIHTSQRAG
jgi:hypothetical protein